MLKRIGRHKEPDFDDAIERILLTMNEEEVGSPEYTKAVVFLERVSDVKVKTKPARVSRDTIIIAAGNLLGILAITFAEQNHIVVSKALSFVMKPKNRDISI